MVPSTPANGGSGEGCYPGPEWDQAQKERASERKRRTPRGGGGLTDQEAADVLILVHRLRAIAAWDSAAPDDEGESKEERALVAEARAEVEADPQADQRVKSR